MKLRRHQLRTIAAVLALGALAGCGTAASAESSPSTPSRSVAASATGTATGVPDQLVANVGISNRGPSAADVLSENNAKTQALLDDLKKAGIDDEDVATTSVDLSPSYDDDGNIDGYQATNMVRVTLRDLKTAGQRLDSLVRIGGNNARIQGISLGFDDPDELLTKARIDAVKRARAQAEEMAKAAGAELGAVRTISDVASSPVVPYTDAYAAADAAGSSVPIAPGSQDLTVQVKVVYALR
ncbi:MAG: SIMPL domain-containing protein [Acidimicrobiales bacterium]|nr:SIMPL domain-containing protein [Actinomycetota bacterium]